MIRKPEGYTMRSPPPVMPFFQTHEDLGFGTQGRVALDDGPRHWEHKANVRVVAVESAMDSVLTEAGKMTLGAAAGVVGGVVLDAVLEDEVLRTLSSR